MKEERGFWVDDNYNRWSQDQYSEVQAMECSKSLIKCRLCVDSRDCLRSENCRYCEGCVDCMNCEGCKDCNDCSYCAACTGLSHQDYVQ